MTCRAFSLIAVLELLVPTYLLCGAASSRSVTENLNKLPLAFERNQGQVQPKVDYMARGSSYTVFLSRGNARIALHGPMGRAPVLDVRLIGARHAPKPTSRRPLPGKVNYFLGRDPAHWHVDIPTFGRVDYRNVYPGIDLAYYGNQGRLEYDFIVSPAADPGGIRIAIAGARKLTVDGAGNLVLTTGDGEVQFHKPNTYQEIAGVQKTVESRYRLDSGNVVRFLIGPYDRSQALVIDPALVYSTYFGGTVPLLNGADFGVAIAVGPQGNVFVAGSAETLDFPTANPLQSSFVGTSAIFVSELTTDGSGPIYSTYLGSQSDVVSSIAVDVAGNAYVVGQAFSTSPSLLPVKNALYPTLNGIEDAFIAKLNPAGNGLVYSTYLGGSSIDYATSVTVDSAQNAYVTGTTASSDFPVTPGAYQTTNPGQNAFVTKISPSGSSLVWSTYFGQSATVWANAIAVDPTGAVYLTGAAGAGLPVTPGAPQPTPSGGFLASLNNTGSTLSYCTYIPGGGSGASIAVDSGGNLYVTGSTSSSDLPVTPGAPQPSLHGYQNAYVAKLNSLGTQFD